MNKKQIKSLVTEFLCKSDLRSWCDYTEVSLFDEEEPVFCFTNEQLTTLFTAFLNFKKEKGL